MRFIEAAGRAKLRACFAGRTQMHEDRARSSQIRRRVFLYWSMPALVASVACAPQPPSGSGGAGGNSGGTGELPCAVLKILKSNCHLCHGPSPAFGAPMPLVTWADLNAVRPSGRVAELVLNRISNDASPMPPPPNARLSQADIDTLRTWVQNGARAGAVSDTCPDAGGTGGTGGSTPFPPDCRQTYSLRAHGGGAGDTSLFPVPTSGDLGNKYVCFYFKPPYAAGSQTLAMRSLFENTNLKYLHHWILYGRDTATHVPGTSESCSASQPGAYFVTGWAPGANHLPLPPDVGLALPPPTGELVLEIHYYNPDGDVGQQDGTGVEFCTAPAGTRPHTAGVSSTGTEGICIEPLSSKEVSGNCVPRTDLGDIHIIGLSPHMHRAGTRMRVEIDRANGVQDVLHDAAFSFDYQTFYSKDAVLRPGDTMRTRCYYQNLTSARVPYGQRTQDEMCYGWVWAWPLGALQNAAPPNPFVADTLPQHRCMGDLDILQSCNGLADTPKPIP